MNNDDDVDWCFKFTNTDIQLQVKIMDFAHIENIHVVFLFICK